MESFTEPVTICASGRWQEIRNRSYAERAYHLLFYKTRYRIETLMRTYISAIEELERASARVAQQIELCYQDTERLEAELMERKLQLQRSIKMTLRQQGNGAYSPETVRRVLVQEEFVIRISSIEKYTDLLPRIRRTISRYDNRREWYRDRMRRFNSVIENLETTLTFQEINDASYEAVSVPISETLNMASQAYETYLSDSHRIQYADDALSELTDEIESSEKKSKRNDIFEELVNELASGGPVFEAISIS